MQTAEITHNIATYPGETEQSHCWTITEEDEVISELWAELATGQITQVRTIEDRRGEGLASALYRAAAATVDLYHSPDEHCTVEGLAFKRAVGGETICEDDAYAPDYSPTDPSEW